MKRGAGEGSMVDRASPLLIKRLKQNPEDFYHTPLRGHKAQEERLEMVQNQRTILVLLCTLRALRSNLVVKKEVLL
jgi:hypothetical protein